MIHSVWNQKKQLYDYYNTSVEQSRMHSPAPSIPKGKFGATIPQATWSLPSGARYAGSGAQAKGRVATSGADFGAHPGLWVLGAIAAYYLFFR